MKKIYWGVAFLMCAAVNVHAAPKTGHWVSVYQDEYGTALVDIHSAAAAALPEQAGLKKFGYKYVYTYGVPSLKIEPKGYVQAVHAVNCAAQTRAYLLSQRFKANGTAMEKAVAMPGYFEPMDLSAAEVNALYQYICKAAP